MPNLELDAKVKILVWEDMLTIILPKEIYEKIIKVINDKYVDFLEDGLVVRIRESFDVYVAKGE